MNSNNEFKNFMSSIPTAVAIVSVLDEDENNHFSCTISSFNSFSIEQGEEEIGFVLRLNSKIGDQIQREKRFSVSFLTSEQDHIAKNLGGISTGTTSENNFENINNFGHIFYKVHNNYAWIYCELSEVLLRKNSQLILGKPIYFGKSDANPLIYVNRNFRSL
jgi:hypothetical protein